MPELEPSDPILELIAAAHEGLVEAVAAVVRAQADDAGAYDYLEMWFSQIENIAMVAEVAERLLLQKLCVAILEDLGAHRAELMSHADQYARTLVQWSEEVSAYLRSKCEVALPESLLLPFAQPRREGVRALLGAENFIQEQPVIEPEYTEEEVVAECAPQPRCGESFTTVDVAHSWAGPSEEGDGELGGSTDFESQVPTAPQSNYEDAALIERGLHVQPILENTDFAQYGGSDQNTTETAEQEQTDLAQPDSAQSSLSGYHDYEVVDVEAASGFGAESTDEQKTWDASLDDRLEVLDQASILVKPAEFVCEEGVLQTPVELSQSLQVDASAGSAEPVDALLTLVGNACQNIVDAVSEWLNNPVAEISAEQVLRSCAFEIDNISVAAQLSGIDDLYMACEAMGQSISQYLENGTHCSAQTGERLIEWAVQVLTYVQQPQDSTLQDVLGIELPVPQLASGLSEAQNEAFDHLNAVSDGDEAQEDGDAAGGDSTQAEILAVLHQELVEASAELSQLLPVMAGADKVQAKSATEQYTRIVGRLHNASESLGMDGLGGVCKFIQRNVEHVLTSDNTDSTVVLLQAWPRAVLTYLKNTSAARAAAAIAALCQDQGWPQPMDVAAADELCESLLRGPQQSELVEVEARPTVAGPEDVELHIAAGANADLVGAIFQESPVHAAQLSAHIQQIAAGVEVLDNVKAAQRLAHTLKGSGNLIGVKGVANLTHHMEDILEYLGAHCTGAKAPIPPALAQTLQEAADCVESMFEALQGEGRSLDDALQVLQQVLDWANRIDAGNLGAQDTLPVRPSVNTGDRTAEQAPETRPKEEAPESERKAAEEVLRVPTRTVDNMFRMVGEMSIAIGQIREYLKRLSRYGEELRFQDAVLQQRKFELEDMMDVRSIATRQRRFRAVAAGGVDVFDSLEMDQYDELYGSSHSYIEAVTDYREMTQRLQNEFAALDALFLQQERLNKELQRVVMSTRMIPVSSLTARLQRCVRQACRATNKQAVLHIAGADLMLDGEVLNKLADPVMHMLRNAVDHGIELPETRVAAGKARLGQVTLHFYQDGNHIVLRCSDDGGGLNYGKIKEGAIKKGLLKETEAVDNKYLARLILTPGFSTRDKATQISGRGVGMDVVNTSIQALKGSLEVGDNSPCGCVVTLRLPVALLTTHAVLVRAGQQMSAVPTHTLLRILAPGAGALGTLGSELTYHMDQEIYPLKNLAQLLGYDSEGSKAEAQSKPVLLVRASEGPVAVAVDQVVSSYDLVGKSMGRYVRRVPGVSSVAILGDGSVVPVMDLPELLRGADTREIGYVPSYAVAAEAAQDTQQVLVVDDSLSVRKSLSQLLEDAGYQPLMARDGVDALEALRTAKPVAVLADMEMPRMNGLELTASIRSDAQWNRLPVIMITSRTMAKHREQAERAGVTIYMTKPFSEDDLLDQLRSVLRANQ